MSNRRSQVTLDHIWRILPALTLLAAIWGLGEIAPNDFWWHIHTGQVILETHHVPQVDLYTFTHAGEPWVYQSWLMEIWLYLVYHLGGAPLVLFIHALMVVSGYILLQRQLLLLTDGNARTAAVLTIGSGVLSMPEWAVRPQSISFPFFTLTLILILRYHHQRGLCLWWLPLIFAIWVNAHGGFFFGLILLGCFALSTLAAAYRARQSPSLREVVGPGIATLVALAINPVGLLGIARYVLEFSRHPATRTLNLEFAPISVGTPPGIIFFAYTTILVAILIYTRYRPHFFEAVTTLVFAILGLWAMRNSPWFGFVTAPVMAWALASSPQRTSTPRSGNSRVNTAVMVILISLTILSLPWLRTAFPAWNANRGVVTRYTPIAATRFACDTLPADARIFNEMSYGSYIIWGCPRLPVFIDTRFELYSLQEWRDYLAVNAGRYDFQELLDRWRISHLFLQRQDQERLAAAAARSSCWQEIYVDEVSIIFARRGGSPCLSR